MNNGIAIVEAYYAAMNQKDVLGMSSYLHDNVEFISPLSTLHGKEAVLKAAKAVMPLFKTISIRARMQAENQVMLAYDWDFAEPIGNLRSAGLFTIDHDRIVKIELFYDARPFAKDLLTR